MAGTLVLHAIVLGLILGQGAKDENPLVAFLAQIFSSLHCYSSVSCEWTPWRFSTVAQIAEATDKILGTSLL